MESNIIINYSDWFNDDGGFEKIEKDFASLGDKLIKEAQRIQKKIKIFDPTDNEQIQDYEKKVEHLSKTFSELERAKKNAKKIEQEYNAQQTKTIKANESQVKSLSSLELKLKQYRDALKKSNEDLKKNNITEEKASEIRSDLKVSIKLVTREINLQQKEILESNKLSKNEQKLIKAKIILQKEQAETIDDIRERISALRIVSSQTNITTEEGRLAVSNMNDEIDSLTNTMSENSDKFIQSKINIGNYEESIKSALDSSGLFKTNISGLDSAINGLIDVLTLSKEEIEAMSQALDGNSNAINRFKVTFGKMNKVLKGSVIGVILILLASLASMFGDTRAGAKRTEAAMQTLSRVMVGLGESAKILFNSFVGLFSGIGDKFKLLMLNLEMAGKKAKFWSSDAKKEAKILAVEIDNLQKKIKKKNDTENEQPGVWQKLKDVWKDTSDGIVAGIENINKAFTLEDKIRRANLQLVKMQSKLDKLNLTAGDSTVSLNEQLTANLSALKQVEKIGNKNLSIARAELRLLNEKLKANIKQRPESKAQVNTSLKGTNFANELLKKSQVYKSDFEVNQDLFTQQQDALLNIRQIEAENQLTRLENSKERREIERDLFEQNLDLLFDVMDVEKNLNEQVVTDVKKNFADRITELDKFILKFRKNTKTQLDEFTKYAKKTGKDIEFDVKYKDDGTFDIFANKTRLSIDNVKNLNEELQSLGIAEIPINRLREWVVETGNSVRDFKNLNEELTLTGIKVDELSSNLGVSNTEQKELDELEKKIKSLSTVEVNSLLTQKHRDEITTQLEALEKRKTEIEKKGNEARLKNKLTAINQELLLVEKGSEKYFQLMQEKKDIERKQSDKSRAEMLKGIKEKNEKATLKYEKFRDEIKVIVGQIMSKMTETTKKSITEQEKNIGKTEQRIDEQRKRAELGLDNTLAYEKKQRAKEEGELIKRNKRLERLEKIKSLWTSYSSYADKEKDPNKAITKTLRDFAVLESITATFEDGGVVGVDGYSKVRTDSKGITRGRSHSMGGGVLAYHQGGEGFFSRDEVSNMGTDNFYWLKNLAKRGSLDKDIFSGQKKEIINLTSSNPNESKLIDGLKDIKDSIDRKPAQIVDGVSIVNGVLQYSERIFHKNKVKKNTFIVKKDLL